MSFFLFREPVNAWSHGVGFLLALLGTLFLWHRSPGDRPVRRLTLLIFGLSLAFCYAASTLYHGLRIPRDRLAVFDRLDRIGIFLLIAGSYTPLAWSLLRGWWRSVTLTAVWLIAIVASGKLAIDGPFPPLWTTGLYLGMGWAAIACYAELARVVSHRALRPLVTGGLFYSAGAVLNMLRWPVLLPGVFGAHELFHLFVLAGSLAHYRLMITVVIPFEQEFNEASPDPGLGAGILVENLSSLSRSSGSP